MITSRPSNQEPSPVHLSDWVDDLHSRGRYTFTRNQAIEATGLSSAAFSSACRRLRQSGRLVMPRRGFYVLVPLEYRVPGSPPAAWFIDPLMLHLDRQYYVALLTAASLHGASHQAAQTFQVITKVPTRPVEVGRVRIEFTQGRATQTPTVRINTPTGTMQVSTREGTAIDLVRHSEAAGGLSNVATVLKELSEDMNPALLGAATDGAEMTVLQRTGFLLELVGATEHADALETLMVDRQVFPTALRTDLPSHGAERNKRWSLVINDQVEPDL